MDFVQGPDCELNVEHHFANVLIFSHRVNGWVSFIREIGNSAARQLLIK